MKKILSSVLAAAFALAAEAQTADPVIMTVAGKPVLRSEFVYSFNKNNGDDVIDKKSVEEYVELFADYRRKVEAALDAKLDTMSGYQQEFRQYRDQQVLPTLVTDADLEAEAHRIYNEENERIGPNGLYDISHILLRVKQNDDDAVMKQQQQRADSVYQALVNGADFATLAEQCSEDPGTAQRGGRIGEVIKGQLLQSFENTMITLQPGEISKPVQSEVGFHIIRLNERKSLAPYDSLRENIMLFIERRNIRKELAENRLKSIAESTGQSEQQVMDNRSDSLSAISEEMKYLIKEYHDGLLLYEVSNREVWEKAANDEAGLERYWKKNRKKYAWDEPRFKGIAYYTKEASDVAAVSKCVKGKRFSDWAGLLRTTFNNDSVLRIRVEKGIFKKGDNGLVDQREFGIADAKPKEMKNYPHMATYGKLLKAPEEMSDVRALVVADYQEELEKEWVKQLRQRYPVTVNEEVLATVKNEVNK